MPKKKNPPSDDVVRFVRRALDVGKIRRVKREEIAASFGGDKARLSEGLKKGWMPDLDQAIAIARFLEVSLDYLVGDAAPAGAPEVAAALDVLLGEDKVVISRRDPEGPKKTAKKRAR